ncbi:MAG: molybdenum cofactor guanylyltransferase [Myxococcota bacterium]
MERVGIVLCGGRSQRMGRPKALLPWFGRSLVEHAVATLAPAVEAVVVVTSPTLDVAPRVEPLGARVVVDREPDRGPLAAIRDGLAAAGAEAAFVTSTDAPFLTRDHVETLFTRAFAGRAHGEAVRAVAPIAEGFVQVLSAVYPGTAWRDADALLAEGIALPVVLLERLGFEALREAGREPLAPWTGFNTPEAYLAFARRRDAAAAARVEWRGEHGATDVCSVPIGRLVDVLQAAAGTDRARVDALAAAPLRVLLSDEWLGPDFDAELPVGPGDRVVVEPRGGGSGHPDRAARA